MMPLVNLRAVESYKAQRRFLARHWTHARVGLLCFTAGLLVMFFIVTAVHLATR